MSKQGDNVSESALNALKKYFRHQSFKSDLQRKAVEAVIKGIFIHKFTVNLAAILGSFFERSDDLASQSVHYVIALPAELA